MCLWVDGWVSGCKCAGTRAPDGFHLSIYVVAVVGCVCVCVCVCVCRRACLLSLCYGGGGVSICLCLSASACVVCMSVSVNNFVSKFPQHWISILQPFIARN